MSGGGPAEVRAHAAGLGDRIHPADRLSPRTRRLLKSERRAPQDARATDGFFLSWGKARPGSTHQTQKGDETRSAPANHWRSALPDSGRFESDPWRLGDRPCLSRAVRARMPPNNVCEPNPAGIDPTAL